MAGCAVTKETICALRSRIAKIEGAFPGRPAAPEGREEVPGRRAAFDEAGDILVRRRGGSIASEGLERARMATGAGALDAALGGGLPCAALTEITSAETRNAGAAAGFAMALAARAAGADASAATGGGRIGGAGLPVIWIGLKDVFHEAGFPHARGAEHLFGLVPERLFISETAKLEDALWIAEEAARLGCCAAVLVEVRGNPAKLGLTATRRLHRRATLSGRPVFMIREAARAEPTAAPFRLGVAPAASALRHTLAGALPHSVGPPTFAVTLDKSRVGPGETFILEWNADDRAFQERRPEDSGAVAPASCDRPADTPALRQALAFEPARQRFG